MLRRGLSEVRSDPRDWTAQEETLASAAQAPRSPTVPGQICAQHPCPDGFQAPRPDPGLSGAPSPGCGVAPDPADPPRAVLSCQTALRFKRAAPATPLSAHSRV